MMAILFNIIVKDHRIESRTAFYDPVTCSVHGEIRKNGVARGGLTRTDSNVKKFCGNTKNRNGQSEETSNAIQFDKVHGQLPLPTGIKDRATMRSRLKYNQLIRNEKSGNETRRMRQNI
jgi:hypothetical protein